MLTRVLLFLFIIPAQAATVKPEPPIQAGSDIEVLKESESSSSPLTNHEQFIIIQTLISQLQIEENTRIFERKTLEHNNPFNKKRQSSNYQYIQGLEIFAQGEDLFHEFFTPDEIDSLKIALENFNTNLNKINQTIYNALPSDLDHLLLFFSEKSFDSSIHVSRTSNFEYQENIEAPELHLDSNEFSDIPLEETPTAYIISIIYYFFNIKNALKVFFISLIGFAGFRAFHYIANRVY